jgi:hypothetical protein
MSGLEAPRYALETCPNLLRVMFALELAQSEMNVGHSLVEAGESRVQSHRNSCSENWHRLRQEFFSDNEAKTGQHDLQNLGDRGAGQNESRRKETCGFRIDPARHSEEFPTGVPS